MNNLQESNMVAKGSTIYNTTNNNIKLNISTSCIDVCVLNSRGMLMRLGDVADLKMHPLKLNSLNSFTLRSTEKVQREQFIQQVLTLLK